MKRSLGLILLSLYSFSSYAFDLRDELARELHFSRGETTLQTASDDIQNLFKASIEQYKSESELMATLQAQHMTYIHNGFSKSLDEMALDLSDLVSLSNEYVGAYARTLPPQLHPYLHIARLELNILNRASFLSTFDQSYMTARFFNEGAFDGRYPKHFYTHTLNELKNDIKALAKANEMIRDTSSLLEDDMALVSTVRDLALNIDTPNGDDLKQMKRQTDKWFEKAGNALASGAVNVLGQIMKKRSFVPKLRFATNFRGNYLFDHRATVIPTLLSEGGMRPGDIIIEKDLMANSDLIIPGYWLHASAYLGTIPDLKRLGLWDSPEFQHIQSEIQAYQTNPDNIRFLNKKLKNTYAFDDIPWFIESDRGGVAVHPLMKFILTDGMAVLRPTNNWDTRAVIRTIQTYDHYVGVPYDYTHNIKNKHSVTCSKIVSHVYDGITFPTSKNMRYTTVSPDQIASPVNSSPVSQDGQLQLIMFFDAYAKGSLTFDVRDSSTWTNYSRYIATLPQGIFLRP